MKTTHVALVASLALTGAALAGCSASVSTSSEPAASGSMVGGPSVCDDATISKAIQDQLDAEGEGVKLFSLDGLTCADGWAVAFPTVGTEEANAITETLIFQAEGQFWIPKDRAAVCGTADMNNIEAYPSDAQIPESLYKDGCTTN